VNGEASLRMSVFVGRVPLHALTAFPHEDHEGHEGHEDSRDEAVPSSRAQRGKDSRNPHTQAACDPELFACAGSGCPAPPASHVMRPALDGAAAFDVPSNDRT